MKLISLFLLLVVTSCSLEDTRSLVDHKEKQNEITEPQVPQPSKPPKNLFPEKITLATNEKYEFPVKGLFIDNSGNKIFSINDNMIVPNGETTGSHTIFFYYENKPYKIEVEIVKATEPEPAKPVSPQEENTPIVKPDVNPGGKPEIAPVDKNYKIKETKWLKGIREPAAGAIKTADGYKSWPENPPATNWYNTMKLAYTHGADSFINSGFKSDASLCYGVVAANMIHWWIDVNRDTINGMGEEISKKIYEEIKYEIPDGNSTYSTLLAKIRDSDKLNHASGGDVREVLYWFFDTYLPGAYDNGNSSSTRLIYSEFVSPADFEAKLKGYIDAGHSVALSYAIKNSGRHIINVFGYSVDDNGKIVEIWIGDSNHGNKDEPFRGSKLIPYGLYYRGGNIYFTNLGAGWTTTNRIEELTILKSHPDGA